METINFLEFVASFEATIKKEVSFELLQLYYAPYAFGSGNVVYRIKGRNIQLLYDGRDSFIEVNFSKPHAKFPFDGWQETFNYAINDFFTTGISKILEIIKTKK